MKFMRTSSPILFDTNVLIYAHNQSASLHKIALNLVKEVIREKIRGTLAAQNLIEFYSIITNPKRIENPLEPDLASDLIKHYLNSPFEIISPKEQTLEVLATLLAKSKIKGAGVFDAYLVATMVSNQITKVLTANIKDFEVFENIKIVDLNIN